MRQETICLSCANSGVVFAKLKNTDEGRFSGDYIFRCLCNHGRNYPRKYPFFTSHCTKLYVIQDRGVDPKTQCSEV